MARDSAGRVIFIPHSAPGDRVKARIRWTEKRYAQAEIIEIEEASSIRIAPRCSVFGQCGGCQWQHLPYELQWKTKSQGVRYALQRASVPVPESWQEFPAEHAWGYRNRIQLRGEGQEIGFFRSGTRERVPARRCEIAREEINSSWEEVRVEGSRHSGQYKVELEVLESGEVRRTWNARHGAAGFRQIHDEQNQRLQDFVYQVYSKPIEEGAPCNLLDLYGGSGNLSRALSAATDSIASIICVDTSIPQAMDWTPPPHFQFQKSAVLPWLLRRAQAQPSSPERPCRALVDPPREGLGRELAEVASALNRLDTRELIAIGCDPDSWARDLSGWTRKGWKIAKAAVFDFFPQTPHVESVAVLVRTAR